jgi:hypothetical protein
MGAHWLGRGQLRWSDAEGLPADEAAAAKWFHQV